MLWLVRTVHLNRRLRDELPLVDEISSRLPNSIVIPSEAEGSAVRLIRSKCLGFRCDIPLVGRPGDSVSSNQQQLRKRIRVGNELDVDELSLKTPAKAERSHKPGLLCVG